MNIITGCIIKGEVNEMNNRKMHDGIVGMVIFLTVALGYFSSPLWLLVPAILGLVLFQSAFSGFCPLYYTLDKINPESAKQ